MAVPAWDVDALVAENARRFSPPAGSRRRNTYYEWGGIEHGAAGLITRAWSRQLQRVLIYNFNCEFPMRSHHDVASIYEHDDPYFFNYGQLDIGGYLYELMHTFRSVRSSVFRISVTVLGWYYEKGRYWQAEYTVRTKVRYPIWFRCRDAVRRGFYKPDRMAGSFYTEFPEGEDKRKYVRRGRRSRRSVVRVRREYDEPPDLFWLTVYAAWLAMEKIIEQLQDRGGRSYLERRSTILFCITELLVFRESIDE